MQTGNIPPQNSVRTTFPLPDEIWIDVMGFLGCIGTANLVPVSLYFKKLILSKTQLLLRKVAAKEITAIPDSSQSFSDFLNKRSQLFWYRKIIQDLIKKIKLEIAESKTNDSVPNEIIISFYLIVRAHAEIMFETLFAQLPEKHRQQLLVAKWDIFFGEPTFLHITASFGVASLTNFLLNQGAPPESFDGLKRTPLWIASHNGKVEIVRVLLAEGRATKVVRPDLKFYPGYSGPILNLPYAHLDMPGSKFDTPLAVAIDGGHIATVDVLLKVRAKINPDQTFKNSLVVALHRAIKMVRNVQDQIKIIKRILSCKGAKDVLEVRQDNLTAFLLAAQVAPLPVLQIIIAAGANIHAENSGQNALHCAVSAGRYDVAEFLILPPYNANPYSVATLDGQQFDVLSLAIQNGMNFQQPFLNFLDFILVALKNRSADNFKRTLNFALWQVIKLGSHIFEEELTHKETHVTARITVEKLLAAGAEPAVLNESKQTPFEAILQHPSGSNYCLTVAAGFIKYLSIANTDKANKALQMVFRQCLGSQAKDKHTNMAIVEMITAFVRKYADIFYCDEEHDPKHDPFSRNHLGNTELLRLCLRGLHDPKQCKILVEFIFKNPEKACSRKMKIHYYKKLDNGAVVFLEALCSFPIVGKKHYQEYTSKIDSVWMENFTELKTALCSLKQRTAALEKFKAQDFKILIAEEEKQLKEKVGKVKQPCILPKIKPEKLPVESKLAPKEAKPANIYFYNLWQCNPKDTQERAEKNVIFVLLIESLQNSPTLTDAFDIIEMGIEQSSRLLGSAEYAEPLKAFLMTPDGKPYLPFRFRSEIIAELKHELKIFLAGLSLSEMAELNAMRARIIKQKSPVVDQVSGSSAVVHAKQNEAPPLPLVLSHPAPSTTLQLLIRNATPGPVAYGRGPQNAGEKPPRPNILYVPC